MFLCPNGKTKHYYFLSALEASKQLHLTSPITVPELQGHPDNPASQDHHDA